VAYAAGSRAKKARRGHGWPGGREMGGQGANNHRIAREIRGSAPAATRNATRFRPRGSSCSLGRSFSSRVWRSRRPRERLCLPRSSPTWTTNRLGSQKGRSGVSKPPRESGPDTPAIPAINRSPKPRHGRPARTPRGRYRAL
jgi:hypothetical protein